MMSYRSLLAEHDLKSTPARLAVLQYLDEQKKPLSAESIGEHLRKEHSQADRVTIYRILESFYKKGLVNRLEFHEGKYRYELSGDDHHHLICERCGSIEDISDCVIKEMEESITSEKKFLIKNHQLEFFGVCRRCQH